MGTGTAVLDGRIGLFTGGAVGNRGKNFEIELAAGKERSAFGAHIVPAVDDLFMDNAGDLTDLHRHRPDAGQLIFRRHIGQRLDHMGNNAELMHGFAKVSFRPEAMLRRLPCRLPFWQIPGRYGSTDSAFAPVPQPFPC